MSIKYYDDRIKENSTTMGTGNLILSAAVTGYRPFYNTIGSGSDKKINYYVYRSDNVFEWEIGIGYISYGGGISQLIREKILASSNNNLSTSFTSGTKIVEPILTKDRIEGSLLNLLEISGNYSPNYISATYIVDASNGNITLSLPSVVDQEPIVIDILLQQTSGNIYSQTDAITITPSGTETINGQSSRTISIKNDTLKIISVPSQTGWLLLDPIQDASNPYGDNGFIQIANNSAFSGSNQLFWNEANKALLVGNSGMATANIVLPASGTIVFNEQQYTDADFRIEGSGNTHLFFVDASTSKLGIGTSNPTDRLHIQSPAYSGITIESTGHGPYLTLYNNDQTTSLPYLGKIIFYGQNSANSKIDYVTLYSKIANNTDGSEAGYFELQLLSGGVSYPIMSLGDDQITFGINSTNVDGINLGDNNNNAGTNIILGNYNSVCAENTVVIGSDMTINSGTFGGTIGYGHSISGNNLWLFGGSGLSATGIGTYLVYNPTNHLSIVGSGQIVYTTQTSDDTVLKIYNTTASASGIRESVSFEFKNNNGDNQTGLLIGTEILSISSGNENSKLYSTILIGGTPVDIIDISDDNMNIGNNSISGSNIVYGKNNTIISSDNIVFGHDIISSTGTNNILIGSNIGCSGNNINIFGYNNEAIDNADEQVTIFGIGNSAHEAYAVMIGNGNTNSGLYSVSCGYQNGAHGEYSVCVGSLNTVTNDSSVVVGRNNTISNTGINSVGYAVGIGNDISVVNTGMAIGFTNLLRGDGSTVIGNNCVVSGSNNIVIGNSIEFSGDDTVVLQSDNNSIEVLSSGIGIYISGNLLIVNLPTSNPLVSGAVWSSGGILRISSGV